MCDHSVRCPVMAVMPGPEPGGGPWRTAPLWGLGYRLKIEAHPTYLHDGRARSAEEAILWHAGEASRAKLNFAKLGPRHRESFLRWLETLQEA